MAHLYENVDIAQPPQGKQPIYVNTNGMWAFLCVWGVACECAGGLAVAM